MAFIDGRVDDRIRLSSGQLIHPQTVRLFFTEEQTIWQYQVVQETVDNFRVAIVGGDDRDALCERLRKRFAAGLGANARVDFSFVDSIPPSAGGKVRTIRSLVTTNGSTA
jgi:phenylacetate-coenzyme A ligase PaaK-like adenylate-forming protein